MENSIKRTAHTRYAVGNGAAFRLLAAAFDSGWRSVNDRRHDTFSVANNGNRISVLVYVQRAVVEASGSEAVSLADVILMESGEVTP